MESIREKYAALVGQMMAKIKGDTLVSEETVYQSGVSSLLPSIDTILKDHLLPGSRVDGLEHLRSLYDMAKTGETSLLLVEHYSNFDLPAFHYLLRQYGAAGQEMADAFVAIAGIKLNESNPAVSAFAKAYSRIVIFPSKYIELIKENYKDPNKLLQEMRRSLAINHAAMRALNRIKTEGKIILVFPAGTRFRPWDPSSKRGVREIASYIKNFSKFCLVAINGNILRINPSGEMEDDLLHKDKLIYTVGPMIDSAEFLEETKREHHFRDDKKQEIVDHLMGKLETMHEEVEKYRLSS